MGLRDYLFPRRNRPRPNNSANIPAEASSDHHIINLSNRRPPSQQYDEQGPVNRVPNAVPCDEFGPSSVPLTNSRSAPPAAMSPYGPQNLALIHPLVHRPRASRVPELPFDSEPQNQSDSSRRVRFSEPVNASNNTESNTASNTSPQTCALLPICTEASEAYLDTHARRYTLATHRASGVRGPLAEPVAQERTTTEEAKKIISRDIDKYSRGMISIILQILAGITVITEAAYSFGTFTIRASLGLPSAEFFIALVCFAIYFIYDKPSELEPEARSRLRKWVSRPLTKLGFYLIFVSIISLALNLTIVAIEDVRKEENGNSETLTANRVNPILLGISFVWLIGCVIPVAFFKDISKFIELSYSNDFVLKLKADIDNLKAQLIVAETNLIQAEHSTRETRNQIMHEVLRLNNELRILTGEDEQYNQRLRSILERYTQLFDERSNCCHHISRPRFNTRTYSLYSTVNPEPSSLSYPRDDELPLLSTHAHPADPEIQNGGHEGHRP